MVSSLPWRASIGTMRKPDGPGEQSEPQPRKVSAMVSGVSQSKKMKAKMMRRDEMGLFKLFIGMAAFAAVVVSEAAWAQQPIAYPAKGQSAAQEDKDTGQCQVWAKKKTGVDP